MPRQSKHHRSDLTKLLPLLLLSACAGEGGTDGPDFLVRDSGGVSIAENAGRHVADTLAWVIDTTEVVRIGMVEGPEEYVFGRLGGMLVTADGHILIADALTHDLRVFDVTGKFVRKVGREGEGPGEFGGISQLQRLTGDTIGVIDQSSQRVDLLDPSLRFVRRYRPHLTETVAPSGMTADKLEGLFADGAPLMSDYLGNCRSGTGEMCADSILFHRTDENGGITARFGRFLWARNESHQVRPGSSVGWGEPHPQAFWTVHGDRLYYADAQRFEVEVYGPDGGLERLIRVNEAAPSFDREAVFPPSAPPEPTGNPRMDEVMRVGHEARQKAELPDTFPSFSDMIVDEEGNIWVREYRPERVLDDPPWWWIFDPEGRLRWGVRSPPGLVRHPNPLRIFHPYIGSDRIVTSVRNEYDVETVVAYRIRKR
jgi:hypothetical protein